MSTKFEVLETAKYHSDVEQITILVVDGKRYSHRAYYAENVSNYDWFDGEGRRIEDPEWAEELDMEDIWRSNEFAKEQNNA
jgi:hypothetical protein